MGFEHQEDKVEHDDERLGEETGRDVDHAGGERLEPSGRLVGLSGFPDGIEEPIGQVAPAPGAESLDQRLASINQVGQVGLEVHEVAVDDHGQPKDHRRDEQGQHRTGEFRGYPPAQAG